MEAVCEPPTVPSTKIELGALQPCVPMAVAMDGGLTFNSVTLPPQFRRNSPECLSAPKTPSVLSIPTFALSTSISFSGGNPVEHSHTTQRALNSRWRTRALASKPLQEGVAEAKRVIDEVLMSKGGDGAGGLAEVSWALYADRETKKLLEDAVTKLSACRGEDFGQFLRSVDSQGVWEVFYAPHIAGLSSAVRTQFRPLQYVLTDVGFSSNVRYFSPLGEGWLSAAGDYVVRDGRTVEILFDSFWADAGRDNLQADPKGKGGIERTLVNLAGRGAFISSLSVYPVYYTDTDVTVFEFTTLRTKIAARKIRRAPSQLS